MPITGHKLRRAAAELLDLFLPQECLGCGVSRTWLCPKCKKQIVPMAESHCHVCRRPSVHGQVHPDCGKERALDGLLVACHKTALLMDLIHNFKYENLTDLGRELAGFMSGKLETNPLLQAMLLNRETLLIPVPLHKAKHWNRGYNQAQLLAGHLADEYSASLSDKSIIRQKPTKTQTELPRDKRMANIKGVFMAVRPEEINGKTVVLVDDVSTTGSTLNELARACKQAGAREVWGIVLVRD